MKYKAEFFDKMQYLYKVTGFNDHMLHCIINFENRIDEQILKKSLDLLMKTIPILSCTYKNHGNQSYWESTNFESNQYITVVEHIDDFNRFIASSIDEKNKPQIKVCLFRSNQDSLSIILNHMITDAAGFKQCIYLLSDIYSHLINNPHYIPDYQVDGDRSFKNVMKEISFNKKFKALLFKTKFNRRNQEHNFPFDVSEEISSFIIRHEVKPEICQAIKSFSKNNHVTINDVLLTAYFRTISFMINKNELYIPIMIDMRKYMKDKRLNALTNISSTSPVNISLHPNEDFFTTLDKLKKIMKKKKSRYIGLNVYLKINTLLKLQKIIKFNDYETLKNNLNNPKICMTNIGVIDSSRLIFQKSLVNNVFMCGSIKYRPHFQMSVSTFNDKMTLAVNLYGSKQDKETIHKFFNQMNLELRQAIDN